MRQNLLMLNRLFILLIGIAFVGCSGDIESTINVIETKEAINNFKNSETLSLLRKTISNNKIVLEYLEIPNRDSIKYIREELIFGEELKTFRTKMNKLNYLFIDTNQIDLFIEQSKIEVDSIIDKRIYDNFVIGKEEYRMISKNVDFQTAKYENSILYKISYPYYTSSRLCAIVLTQCVVNGTEIEWISIFVVNEKKEWSIDLVVELGKEKPFALEYSKTPFEH
jgi:hypothetical protein